MNVLTSNLWPLVTTSLHIQTATLAPSLSVKEKAFCHNHPLISRLKHLLLSSTGMKAFSPDSRRSNMLGNFQRREKSKHTTVLYCLSVSLLPDFDCLLKYIIIFTFPSWRGLLYTLKNKGAAARVWTVETHGVCMITIYIYIFIACTISHKSYSPDVCLFLYKSCVSGVPQGTCLDPLRLQFIQQQ